MGVALGLLGWSPVDFWQSTMFDLHCGVEGYRRAQGNGPGGKPTKRQVKELQSFLSEMKKRGMA